MSESGMTPTTDDLSGTLRKTFAIYGEHLRTFVLVSAIVSVPTTLVTLAFARASAEAGATHELIAVLMNLLPMLPLAIAFFVQSAAIDVAVVQATLGARPSVESAYVGALRKIAPIFVVSLYTALVTAAGFICFFVPGVVFMCRYAYALPIVVVEGLSPREAMTRAAVMSDGRKLRLLGIYVVLGFVTSTIVGLGDLLFGGVNVPYLGPLLRALPAMITAALCPIAVMVEYLAARAAEPAGQSTM